MIKNLCIFFLLYPLFVFSKEKPQSFIAKIIGSRSPVLVYNFQSSTSSMPILKITDLKPTFNFSGQALTKNNKGLFLNPLGTGRVYQWVGDQYLGEWKRIDSTFYTGYNFLSLFFSTDSTLYSFGGIGFWYQNGNLRKYNFTSHEWNAKVLTNSIPWHTDMRDLIFVDTINNELYFNGQGRYHDASLKNLVDSSTLNKLYKINIATGILTELGTYETLEAGFFSQTPWGTITNYNKIADVVNNKIYRLSESVENNLFRVLAKSNTNRLLWLYTYWMDSCVYFASPNDGYDSVIIRKSDLIPTDQPVYKKEILKTELTTSSNIFFGWGSLLSLALILNAWIYYKYRKEKNKIVNHQHKLAVHTNIIQQYLLLTEVEKSLLKLIFEDSILSKLTSIASINNVLGCSNKSIEIQKRQRSDAINALNEKLSTILMVNEKIIDRKRSEFDARSFEYFIHQKHFQQIEKILND
jgi:cbb3-type cytochrome oxidase subunit 3